MFNKRLSTTECFVLGMQKRAHWNSQYSADLASEEVAYPYRKKSEATSMIGSYTRRKRYNHGVYNECCQKSCTEEELSSYCGAPPVSGRGRR